MKNSTTHPMKAILSFLIFTFVSLSLSASENVFELSGTITDNSGPVDNVQITIYDGSLLVKNLYTSTTGTFLYTIAFNKSFKIILEKEGYAPENIIVNTTLAQDVPTNEMAHHIALNLFLLSSTKPFTFEEPVASIFFHKYTKAFSSEVIYNKTFTSNTEKAENVHDKLGNADISQEYKYELSLRRNQAKKKVEIKALTEVEVKSTTIIAQPEEVKKQVPVEIKEVAVIAKEEEKVTTIVAAVDVPKKKVYVEKETTKNAQLLIIYENQKKAAAVKIERKEVIYNVMETITENTRVINKINLLIGIKTIEYSKITYKNGGVYYFKNGASISADVFERKG
jgi:hypothetical protein